MGNEVIDFSQPQYSQQLGSEPEQEGQEGQGFLGGF
jgi:hypothetical protein